jgi:hypothetical protein
MPGTLCGLLLGDRLHGAVRPGALRQRRRFAGLLPDLTEHHDEFRSGGLDGLKRVLDLRIQSHGWLSLPSDQSPASTGHDGARGPRLAVPKGTEEDDLAIRRGPGAGDPAAGADGGVTMDPEELKWRQYALLVDLYKFYLELFLKFNIFFYAVTGAIMSVYLAKLD